MCKHRWTGLLLRDVEVWDPMYRLARMSQRFCTDCDTLIAIGPARDTPETAVEVRAAEIAEDGSRGQCSDDCEWHDCERCGWMNWNDNRPELRDDTYTDAWWAGYLARCIHDHDSTHEADHA